MIVVNKNEKVTEEQKISVIKMFIDTKLSDKQLEALTGISRSTIDRSLKNLELIEKAFPGKGVEMAEQIAEIRKQNKQNGRVTGGQMSQIKYGNMDQENQNLAGNIKFSLEDFYSQPEKQFKLLIHLMLTFRIKPALLSQIISISEQEIIDGIYKYCDNTQMNSFVFLIQNDSYADQVVSVKDVINYLFQFKTARKNKDKIELKRLIDQIDDSQVAMLLSQRTKGSDLSDENIRTILKYQIKYGLHTFKLAELFGLHRGSYVNRIHALPSDDFVLVNYFEYIANFYEQSKRNHLHGRR